MIYDSSVEVSNNIFFSSHAIKDSLLTGGKGGAIYLTQALNVFESYFNSNNFSFNTAYDSGGAIQWYGNEPRLNSNVFNQNKAIYGPDFASFSCKLVLSSPQRGLNELNLVPGQPFNGSLQIQVKDHYDQLVTNENSLEIQLVASDSENITISGVSSLPSNKGLANFESFTVFGPPGTSSFLKIKTVFPLGEAQESNLNINFTFRECLQGEKLELGMACRVCSKGTYNLKAGGPCLKCPTGGICKGGDQIFSAAGYWRASKTSDKMFECPNPDACLEETDNQKCQDGYSSVLCQSCQAGYSRTASNVCSKCLEQNKNIILIIGMCLIAVFVIIAITYLNIIGAYKEQSITSIYFKILLNYFQVVALTFSFNLSWPRLVREMFEVQGKAVGSSDMILSIDCFFDGKIKAFYIKLIIVSVIPIICFMLSLIFWVVWKKLRKCENFKEKFIGSIVVQLIFFQPSIARYSFSTFNCTEVMEGEFYLTEDMSIKCWNKNHMFYSLCIALPSILIWSITIGGMLFFFLYHNRNNLDEITQRLKFGFLYRGYKSPKFYWEFVIMLKKLMMISTSVFLKSHSIPIQALIAFLIISFGYLLQIKLQPYTYKQLNVMEARSIVVSAVTIYSGLLFLTGDLNGESKIVVFAFMVISNFLFLSYWIYYTFGYYLGKLYKKYNFCKKLWSGKLDNWVNKVAPEFIIPENIKGNISVVSEEEIRNSMRSDLEHINQIPDNYQ